MEPILTDIYHGNILFSAENQNIACHWNAFFEALKVQAPELEKKFDVLRTEITRTYFSNSEEMFYRGFSFAVKLLTEALSI